MVYHFKKAEEEVLKFWEEKRIYEKIKKKNKFGKKFYFLDGPPYTTGRVHIGTAWNKVMKDMVLRYKRMNGFDVWDRAGYDMHGLPIESKTQKKLGLKYKEDIEKLGVDKFVRSCKELALENLKLMNDDFIRLGVWMDFKNAYRTLDEEYMEGEWWLIKKAFENKRLYEDYRPMPWDYVHQTALAKHELEYKTVIDKSIFVKFKVKNKDNEYLIIWTTTPWTIVFNLGVMVNPNLDYVRARVKDEVWILAKSLAGPVIQAVADKKFEILDQFKGKKLQGLEYEHPFYEELKKQYDDLKKKASKVHTVVLSSEYVTLDAGSGLVHMAPGCGPEDYEVGHKNKIPAWNNLTEDGKYPGDMGKFSGRHAKLENESFIDDLEKTGNLIAINEVEHEYPFGQRSQEPIIFRSTKQWFFKVEDLKSLMIRENKKVKWMPDSAFNAFDSWLNNLRDNSITKQRYWGTPVPIWKCKKCEDYLVVGSKKELEKLAKKKIKELHKPWIDRVKIKCKCGGTKERILDTLDVWVDAGAASWNCLYYPRKKELFKKYFPADFILEGKDQIRGWFNLLMITSILALKKPSFKSVYMHGFVQDLQGRKFSKSLGNAIYPEEVISKYGVDTLRYYTIGGANPGVDLNYNFDDMNVKYRNLIILWNITNYLINYSESNLLNKRVKNGIEEKFILSKLNSKIKEVSEAFEDLRLNEVPLIVEDLFLSLSRDYIKLTRNKMNSHKDLVLITTFKVLIESLKLFSPVAPFITEAIYQDLKKKFKLKEESIHLMKWPKFDRKLIDKKLEESFELMDKVIQEGLAQREGFGYGVRWPLPKLEIACDNNKLLMDVEDLIKEQVNVKEVMFSNGNFKVKLDSKITKELEKEGYLREVLRRIQVLRKKNGLKVEDRIRLDIKSGFDLSDFEKEIKDKVGAKNLSFDENIYKINSKEKIKGVIFEISFQKV